MERESLGRRFRQKLRALRHSSRHNGLDRTLHSCTPVTTKSDEQSSRDIEDVEQRIDLLVTPTEEHTALHADSDLWSAAFAEAVRNLGNDIDSQLLEGKTVEQLFNELEKIGRTASEESAFLRGVKFLHSIHVPLEHLKLALDITSPLSALDPAALTVFTVIRGVTAIAITFASADRDFAKQVGQMLQQISYIDDCDTLGRRSEQKDIHQALVLVYQKILEFYKAAYDVLTRRGAKLVVKMILEKDRLPEIMEDFLKHASFLQTLVQKAMWEIVEDIKNMLYDHEIARWLGSEKMSRQSRYHTELKHLRADKACEFVLKDQNFIEWYKDTNSRQLLLVGDMGSGKTVAVAFILEELQRRSEQQIPQPKICYHYCRDDDSGKAVHIMSTLILAILEQLSGLKKAFYDWYKRNQASGNLEPGTDVDKLEEFLVMVLESLDRPLYIAIDGLDECDRDSRNTILQFLGRLTQKNPRLKALLSSRPEEEILQALSQTPQLHILFDAKRDEVIIKFSVEKVLPYLLPESKAIIIDRLSSLACGSAIWVKMVVELIRVRGIRAPLPMERFLENIPMPDELNTLYDKLVVRCTSDDAENKTLSHAALRILSASRRPLSILELAWAVALGSASPQVTTIAALGQLVDHQRILDLIRPFISRIDFSDLNKRQVRLVHQSVKEYVMIIENQSQDSYEEGCEYGEAFILNICIRYLLLEDIGSISIFSAEQSVIDELPHDINLFDDDIPEAADYDVRCSWEEWEKDMIRFDPSERGFGKLFVYAASKWLEHYGALKTGPLANLADIEMLCQAGSTRLKNWIEQNCRPDCVIKPRFPFDSSLYDPLSITSLYGSEEMLRCMLTTSKFPKDKYHSHSAMKAADQILQWGSLSQLDILFQEGQLTDQLHSLEFFQLLIDRWSHRARYRQDWRIAFDLVNHVSEAMVSDRWGNELLCAAAGVGCLPLVQRLMTNARDHSSLRSELLRANVREEQFASFRSSTHQSIGEAVLGDHVNVVEFLLQIQGIEAHLLYMNANGETVLHLASKHCNPRMFSLLLPRFLGDLQQKDRYGETVLSRVISNRSESRNRYKTASLILKHNNNGVQDLLQKAIQLGDLDMCHVLIIASKVDPRSSLVEGIDGHMRLRDETTENEGNRSEILQFLLDTI